MQRRANWQDFVWVLLCCVFGVLVLVVLLLLLQPPPLLPPPAVAAAATPVVVAAVAAAHGYGGNGRCCCPKEFEVGAAGFGCGVADDAGRTFKPHEGGSASTSIVSRALSLLPEPGAHKPQGKVQSASLADVLQGLDERHM